MSLFVIYIIKVIKSIFFLNILLYGFVASFRFSAHKKIHQQNETRSGIFTVLWWLASFLTGKKRFIRNYYIDYAFYYNWSLSHNEIQLICYDPQIAKYLSSFRYLNTPIGYTSMRATVFYILSIFFKSFITNGLFHLSLSVA